MKAKSVGRKGKCIIQPVCHTSGRRSEIMQFLKVLKKIKLVFALKLYCISRSCICLCNFYCICRNRYVISFRSYLYNRIEECNLLIIQVKILAVIIILKCIKSVVQCSYIIYTEITVFVSSGDICRDMLQSDSRESFIYPSWHGYNSWDGYIRFGWFIFIVCFNIFKVDGKNGFTKYDLTNIFLNLVIT